MSISQLFAEHHFSLTSKEVSQFSAFLDAFLAYNSHTNLSAIRESETIIEKHFIDSVYGAEVI